MGVARGLAGQGQTCAEGERRRVANDGVADFAVGGKDVHGGEGIDVKELGGGATAGECGVVDVVFLHVSGEFFVGAVVEGDAVDVVFVAVFFVECGDVWGLYFADAAPGCPEVKKRGFSGEVGLCVDVVVEVVDGEFRSHFARGEQVTGLVGGDAGEEDEKEEEVHAPADGAALAEGLPAGFEGLRGVFGRGNIGFLRGLAGHERIWELRDWLVEKVGVARVFGKGAGLCVAGFTGRFKNLSGAFFISRNALALEVGDAQNQAGVRDVGLAGLVDELGGAHRVRVNAAAFIIGGGQIQASWLEVGLAGFFKESESAHVVVVCAVFDGKDEAEVVAGSGKVGVAGLFDELDGARLIGDDATALKVSEAEMVAGLCVILGAGFFVELCGTGLVVGQELAVGVHIGEEKAGFRDVGLAGLLKELDGAAGVGGDAFAAQERESELEAGGWNMVEAGFFKELNGAGDVGFNGHAAVVGIGELAAGGENIGVAGFFEELDGT